MPENEFFSFFKIPMFYVKRMRLIKLIIELAEDISKIYMQCKFYEKSVFFKNNF